MRTLDRARNSWHELQRYGSLRELKDAVRLDPHASAATAGLRSACWKAFLVCESLDAAEWQRKLTTSRSAYNELRTHLFRYIDNPHELEVGFDPLSQDAESSPWARMKQDEELRAEILQDVDRCMPDNPYFRQNDTQRMLLDILFVFCKLNPDVGYRQGMHEIAAPILWVVENDAVDVGESSKTMGEDSTIKTVFDAEHIEHDTFAIFGQVMQSAKSFYLSEGPVSIAARSRHIFNELLPLVDPELMKHLESLDVVPQVFLIRWIRLLFGREFDFESVLTLWDVIFAEDSSLEIVDHISLAMLLRIRWHLLDADYNAALGLLLKYPEQDKDFPAQTLGLDALYLRNHMTKEGGSHLVLKYTGRPMALGRPTTPPALQRNITMFSGDQAIRHARSGSGLSPTRAPRQARNIEVMLQNTAKNIYARGEKLGIGKVVRSAVDEVHKKAQEIRDSQAASPQPWQVRGDGQVLDRVKQLEARNKKLAELLSGAVGELWHYEKLVTSGKESGESDSSDFTTEKLSAAIAKVQFVQVYLDEPSLALAEDEVTETSASDDFDSAKASSASTAKVNERLPTSPDATYSSPTRNALSQARASPAMTAELADPSTFDDFSEDPISTPAVAGINQQTRTTDIPTTDTEPKPDRPSSATHEDKAEPLSPKASRPPLDQSPFSFMLGQETKATSPGRALNAASTHGQGDASLFSTDRSRSKSRTPQDNSIASTKGQASLEESVFDMGSLRRAKGGKK